MAKTGQRVSTQNQVVKFENGDTTSVTSSSASIAIASESCRVYSTTACYLKSGDSTVTASSSDYDIYLPALVTYDISVGSDTHLAAIRDSADGTLHTSEAVG